MEKALKAHEKPQKINEELQQVMHKQMTRQGH